MVFKDIAGVACDEPILICINHFHKNRSAVEYEKKRNQSLTGMAVVLGTKANAAEFKQ